MIDVPRIVCVGTVTMDLLLVVDRLPHSDERVEASDVALAGGGNAANAAVAIARLGLPVEFCGTVGDDRAGALVVEELASEGVGTSLIERRPGVATAQSAVMVSRETGERAIVTRPAPPPPPVPEGFDIVHLDKAGWGSVVPGATGQARLSVDDGNIIPDLDLSLLCWYVPTATVLRERFATQDPVEGARQARAQGAQSVIATDGARGSFGLDNEGTLHFAPALAITPRSTLGAGDVFHGALIAAYAMGKPMLEALRFANVTAALSCRALDGRSGVPGLGEVLSALCQLGEGQLTENEVRERFTI